MSESKVPPRRSKAMLFVAKLDRLARNVAFLSLLMEADVGFIAIDLVHANHLTIHIRSAVAEGEANVISDRTTAALQAANVPGTALGSARPAHGRTGRCPAERPVPGSRGIGQSSSGSGSLHQPAPDNAGGCGVETRHSSRSPTVSMIRNTPHND